MLQRIDDVQLAQINVNLAADIKKRTICLFVAELLYKVLKHPMRDAELFDFLVYAIQTLEQCEAPHNFHISFLLRLTQFLGFYPDFSSRGQWLDLRTGVKNFGMPLHPDCISTEHTILLEQIAMSEDLSASEVSLSRADRRALLDILILYYSLHLDSFYTLKSLDILAAVFEYE